MDTFLLPLAQSRNIKLYTDQTLRYRYGAIAGQRAYIYCAMLKVSAGLRYVLGRRVRRVPEPLSVISECVLSGTFVPRPYMLGQQSDACSDSCALALLYACCRTFGIDFSTLIRNVYGALSPTVLKQQYGLEAVTMESQWQGVQYPYSWSSDAVLGLTLSLYSHRRPRLRAAFLSALETATNHR
jgi:hypothetical protein